MAKAKVNRTAVGAAVALTAAAAAAAVGAYWLYGAKNAAKHRKMVKSWMLKARAEVMEAVEKLSEIDKATYMRIVDNVVQRYAGMAGVTSAEISRAARDLKASWKYIGKEQRKAGTKSKPRRKKTSRKKTKSKKK